MKLIRDWHNGGRWQWRYWHSLYRIWCDYGPSFKDRSDATRYGENNKF